MRYPVTVEAVTSWKLATNIEYHTLASLGKSTVGGLQNYWPTMYTFLMYTLTEQKH